MVDPSIGFPMYTCVGVEKYAPQYIFPHILFKEIQKGSGAKLYMKKSFLIYEEMRKDLVIGRLSHNEFAPDPLCLKL
jgi:hypothetical protein